ncbi:protein unc-93 homolog A-like [Asterias rubens]|uniref:protein unc-93 homolog A-like n=1 Tax=Asterias rubens TaxID=7604 RepID=UPI0014554FE8|nr:protein unc-93 homolog A-like [Asterias rubens]
METAGNVFNTTSRRNTVNIVAVCVVFAFNSFSYSSLQSLQSSLNPSKGLGLASLSCLFAAMSLSSLFISPIMIRKLGTKRTMILGSLTTGLYAVSNFFPRFYTIVPSALICGLAAGPNWSAVSTYLHTLAQDKARVTGEERAEVLTSRYLGLVNTAWQVAYIISTFFVSNVMTNNAEEDGVLMMQNFSVSRCGARDCGADMPQEAVGAVKPPDYIIHIFLACFSTSGLIVAPLVGVFFIQDIGPKYKAVSAAEVDATPGEETITWLATLKALQRPQLLMLTPFAVYTGMFYSFVMADFTKSFVSCTQGIHMVGYVIMTFATADAVFTVVIGWIRKVLGRLALFTGAAAINIAVMAVCLVWNPDLGERWHLHSLAVALALCDAVWTIQIRVLASVLFPNNQEPVFSAIYFFSSIGNTISFATSIPSSVCISYKLYGLTTLLCVSMLLYYTDEVLVKMKDKRGYKEGGEVTREVVMVSFDDDGAVKTL